MHADMLVIGSSTLSLSAATFREDPTIRLPNGSNIVGHEVPEEWQPCEAVTNEMFDPEPQQPTPVSRRRRLEASPQAK